MTTFDAPETVLSERLSDDQEFGLFSSPFSSAWWPEVARGSAAWADARRPEGLAAWSADGIGVLAPAPLFHPAPLPAMERRPDVNAILGAAPPGTQSSCLLRPSRGPP